MFIADSFSDALDDRHLEVEFSEKRINNDKLWKE